jgi:hypothetical protein
MTDAKRAEVARDNILNVLSDEEVAKVSTAETASGLTEGAEYLDLEHLDQGVQRAKAATKTTMGHVLPRSAVSDETWSKILAQLAATRRHPGSDARGSEDRHSWVSAVRSFVKHRLG